MTRRLGPRRWTWLPAVLLVAGTACGGASVDRARPVALGPVRLASTTVIPVPTKIDATGKADVTNAMQSFLDSLPDDAVVQFRKNGRYRVEGTLYVTDHASVLFDGQNATIFATTRGTLERSQWFITGGGGIIFRNMVVRGANPHAGTADNAYDPRYEKQHGFRIEGVQGIELNHVTVTDVYGDFVYISRAISTPSTNVWVHDSTFRRNGRQGVSVVCANNVIIERNTITDTRRAVFDLEPNGPNQLVSNTFLLNNTVGAGRLLFVASHGKGPVNRIVISGNHLHKHLLTLDDIPPSGQRRADWILTNNTSDMLANTRPIRFIATDGVLVSGNTQHVVAKQPAVELTNVCTARIEHNDFGAGGVSHHGATCSAHLDVPKEPNIPGRP